MSSSEAFGQSDSYGRRGENLARELLIRRDIDLQLTPNWPRILPVDNRVRQLGQMLAATPERFVGIEHVDRSDPVVCQMLEELVNHRVDKDSLWFELMGQQGESNLSKHNDFKTGQGYRVETKHDGMFSGYRTGVGKQGGTPTFNMCFEICNGFQQPSGIYRDHSYFSYVLDNRFGEPLLVIYDQTLRLRKYVEHWKRVKAPKFGGNDNSWMVLVWFPYYLNGVLPNIEE